MHDENSISFFMAGSISFNIFAYHCTVWLVGLSALSLGLT
jgi:hypothetical protein